MLKAKTVPLSRADCLRPSLACQILFVDPLRDLHQGEQAGLRVLLLGDDHLVLATDDLAPDVVEVVFLPFLYGKVFDKAC